MMDEITFPIPDEMYVLNADFFDHIVTTDFPAMSRIDCSVQGFPEGDLIALNGVNYVALFDYDAICLQAGPWSWCGVGRECFFDCVG